MYSVLIDALFTSSPDYERLFESLCWPAESWPETERVKALTAFIQGLEKLFADPDKTSLSAAQRRRIQDKVESVIWAHCLPLLARISAEPSEPGRCRESTAALCLLLSACVPLCDETVPRRVAVSVLPSLQVSEEEALNVDVSIEVMAALIPSLSEDENITIQILSTVLSCIKTLPVAQVSKATVRLLLTLLNCCSSGRSSSIIKSIQDDLCSWYCSNGTSVVTERVLLCLTVLSDHLLTPSSSSNCNADPRLSHQFWRIIQDGLTHKDSVSRKRALYLLKRCVALSEEESMECSLSPMNEGESALFKWAPGKGKLLREFWEDYVLVMETLEENQVHVVRPVLNRIDTLIQTTVNDGQDQGLIHPSWLLCVYQRMFHSENKSLMREGVCHLLELQVLSQPHFALAFSQFVVGPFMEVLAESSLFQRSVGQNNVGDCPELGAKLQVFLANFFCSLPSQHRGSILLQLIQQLGCKHWCAVPLLFLCQALSKLSPSPLLGRDGFTALREVLRCTMITHQVLLRGAAQCFLLNTALSLTDVSAVSLDDVFSFLTHFRADESLCRGTQLWTQVCDWLSENEGGFSPSAVDADQTGAPCTKETIREHIQGQICAFLRVPASTGQTDRLPDPKEAEKLARSVLLCVDVEHSRSGADITNTLELLLSPLLDTLSRVSTNIYLPLRKSDKSLQLVLQLFQLGQTPGERGDAVIVTLEKLMLKLLYPIQDFILRRLCGELQELFDVERAELYLSVLSQLWFVSTSTAQQHIKVHRSDFSKLIKHSLTVLQEPSLQTPSMAHQGSTAVAMAALARVCGLVEQEVVAMRSETGSALKTLNDYLYSSELGNFNRCLLKPQTEDFLCDDEVHGPLLKDWGRIAANFMRDQWVCLSFLVKTFGIPENSRTLDTVKAALSRSVDALALLPNDLVLPVLTFMETILPQLLTDEEELCVEAVTQSWELVQGLTSNANDFWSGLKGFVSMAFNPQLLQLSHGQALKFTSTLKKISLELIELSQSKSGVFGVLLHHCSQTWMPTGLGGSDHADAVFSSVFSHIHILTEACVYGPVFRRDQRLIQDVQTYVEQLGEECAVNVALKSDNSRDEQYPRMCVLSFLSRLDSSNPLHEKVMETVVMALLKKDNDLSRSKVRAYSNSLQHRVKNRVWQTLLLLLPKLRDDFVTTSLTHVFEAGYYSNQASVKYLIEWMMILILIRYPQHMDSFWACFNMDHEKTKTSVCTYLSVLVHFDIILPHLEDQPSQLRRALDIILQWCFNHNFSVRLYALLALKRVWQLAAVQAEGVTDGLGGLSTVIKACLNQAEAMQNTGNANKNWIRIQEHFFFGAFHPVEDYSAETIFYTFPSLSEVADDEWIPLWKFEKLLCFSECSSLPLKNPSLRLSQLQSGDWIQQDKNGQDKEERWAEVQKKITPWRLEVQEQEPELNLVPSQRAARLGKPLGALLVVASLIDKPTNLGGLCRTCEIFGASALVLDNLRHINDKNFQSLSVSSELWLPLLEVKPVELSDFLQQKKSEGYCIVGVEQTANSQSLDIYRFPEKTLLLLGNEREGIPANLLQLLDVCVEIPQQGVIRSLNVHVSAALLIWEYTRQHLSSGSS